MNDTRRDEKMKKKMYLPICLLFVLCMFCVPRIAFATERDQTKYYSDIVPGTNMRAVNAQGTWHNDQYGWWFEYSGGGYPQNTWEYINNYYYYFNGDGYMLHGWVSVNGFWYYLSETATGSIPEGAMLTGWVTVNGKEYYLEENTTATVPLGGMITGWRDFPVGTQSDDHRWAFFNLSNGDCEVKGQHSIGCVHGKTTYNDNTLLTAKTNITYTYIGSSYAGNVTSAAKSWTNSSAGITLNFVPSTTTTPPKIYLYDGTANTDILAYTIFVSGSSNIDPRSDDWSVSDIYINTTKPTSSITSGIIAHELGHAIGLDHRDADSGSLMYTKVSTSKKQTPAAIDIENVKHLY